MVKSKKAKLTVDVSELETLVRRLINEALTPDAKMPEVKEDGALGPKTREALDLEPVPADNSLEHALVVLANQVYESGQGDIKLTDYIDALAARAGEIEAEANELELVRSEVRIKIVRARQALDRDLWFPGVEQRNAVLKELGELLSVKEAELL